MPAPAAGLRYHGIGEGAVLALEVGERLLAALAGIDVEHPYPADGAGADGDMRIRPRRPPPADDPLVGARVEQSVARARMLAAVAAAGRAAAAPPVTHGVRGEHAPAASGVGECGDQLV